MAYIRGSISLIGAIWLHVGISVIDVRIRRVDLPAENEESIYARMEAERNRQANKYRSEGEEEAQKMLEGKIQSLLEALKNGFDEEMSEDNMENIDPVSGMPNKGSEKEFVVMNMILPPSIIKDFIKEGFLDEDSADNLFK